MKKAIPIFMLISLMGCSQLIPALFSDDPLKELAKSAEGIEVLGITVLPADQKVEVFWQLRDTVTKQIVTGGQIDFTLAEFKAIKSFQDLLRLIGQKVMMCSTSAVKTGAAKIESQEAKTSCQIVQ